MVAPKRINILNLKYQTYLTYIGIIWTVGISFFIAVWSYLLTSLNKINTNTIIILSSILLFAEIIFIGLYFWINFKKLEIEKEIENS
mgnify:CR=1 FL=1